MLWLLLPACGDADDAPSDTDSGIHAAACEGTGLVEGDQLAPFEGISTYVHVPAGSGPCAPLVVFLHGTLGAGTWDGTSWVEPRETHLAEAADMLGFVLVVPGVAASGDTHDWALSDVGAGEVDAAIEGVQVGYSVDAEATFVMGVSKGGLMAAWYGLYHPERARGIGVVSGGYTFDYPSSEPTPKLPYYVAHDPDDSVSPYEDAVRLSEDLAAHGHVVHFEDWALGEDGHGWNPDLPADMFGYFMELGG